MPTPDQYAAALTEEPTIAGFARYMLRGKKLKGEMKPNAIQQYASGGYAQYAADQASNGLTPMSQQEYMRRGG